MIKHYDCALHVMHGMQMRDSNKNAAYWFYADRPLGLSWCESYSCDEGHYDDDP